MGIPVTVIHARVSSRCTAVRAVSAAAFLVALLATAVLAYATPVSAGAARAAEHFACSGPSSSRAPCHFSTPSGNIRCLWMPTPNNVACELLATGRAYRLRPNGKAKAVRLRLARRGETLPRNQQLALPGSLSCHDTSTTMTCNQEFGLGAFRLAPRGSRAS